MLAGIGFAFIIYALIRIYPKHSLGVLTFDPSTWDLRSLWTEGQNVWSTFSGPSTSNEVEVVVKPIPWAYYIGLSLMGAAIAVPLISIGVS